MNQKIKEKWIEALCSGKYKQGRGVLRDCDNRFCCLGVLCDVFDSTKWAKHDKINYSYEHVTTTLPQDLRQYLGISCDYQDILTQKNDLENKSFNEIADWIKENL